ncbi:MAG: hypothetical protein M1491_00465 [Deltaproteobacteria bacterium]|nr:hypothetical protein [Deltaproteobacteria bacterium]MCL5278263.1 hypothetical protein [Deltaproteobacteria bacterium]
MFGQFLIERKVITMEQLTEALNAQVVFGGRLGTNLIESGVLTETGLEAQLAEYYHLQPIPLEKTLNIKTNVLKLIPLSLVRKFRAIPFDQNDKQIHVVFMDPGRLDAIDELSFGTGMTIRPYVVPEIRFLLMLEHYYGIKRDVRYITLSRQDAGQFMSDRLGGRQAAATVHEDERPPAVRAGPSASVQPLSSGEELTTEEEFQKMLRAPRPIPPVPEDEGPAIELSQEMEMETELRLMHPASMTDAMSMLSMSGSRDDIASVVLGHALSVFRRAALFIIYKGIAMGWEGAGEGVKRSTIKQLVIPLDQASVFKFVRDTGAYFVGPAQDNELDRDFFFLLGGRPPRTVVIIPIHFRGSLVQMLYGDNGEGEFASTDIGELLVLLQKVPEVIGALVAKMRRAI